MVTSQSKSRTNLPALRALRGMGVDSWAEFPTHSAETLGKHTEDGLDHGQPDQVSHAGLGLVLQLCTWISGE